MVGDETRTSRKQRNKIKKHNSSVQKQIVKASAELQPDSQKGDDGNERKPVPLVKLSPMPTYRVYEEINQMRKTVEEAMRRGKTFMVYNNFFYIRDALLARGWVEKFPMNVLPELPHKIINLLPCTIPELVTGLNGPDGAIRKKVIYSKMITDKPVGLYWNLSFHRYWNHINDYKSSYVNFITKTRCMNYSNKQGLCECMEESHWFCNPGIACLQVPRSYCVGYQCDPADFIADFKITAAMSLLKWVVDVYETKKQELIMDNGVISLDCFQFALEECRKFESKLKHEDIDIHIPKASELEWKLFLDCFTKLVHLENSFMESSLETEKSMVDKSKEMLNKLRELWRFVDMDGFANLWILKPNYGSRGVGIHICNSYMFVLDILDGHKNMGYVVQKYIERPFLIYNTKFDIRQWFLISKTRPLTIWIWKNCYLRFSSQSYDLSRLHESIHLTNYAVQSKYSNDENEPSLPECNMWHSDTFKEYLNTIGQPSAFKDKIYPGMKECITGAIMCNQDQIIHTPKSFELYGADFILTEDFQPWLLEINAKPALKDSTPITSKIVPEVLDDVMKVVLDLNENPKASTGKFELIYKESSANMLSIRTSLRIKGESITPPVKPSPAVQKVVKPKPPKAQKKLNLAKIPKSKSVVMMSCSDKEQPVIPKFVFNCRTQKFDMDCELFREAKCRCESK